MNDLRSDFPFSLPQTSLNLKWLETIRLHEYDYHRRPDRLVGTRLYNTFSSNV